MSAPDRDLTDQLFEVLSPHYGALTQASIDVIAEQVAAVVQQREQQAEARSLREFAARRDDMARAWGGSAAWLTTGNSVADLVADWANEAADEKENG